jgi:MBOAT, membrane-bound O-acyltransferase family
MTAFGVVATLAVLAAPSVCAQALVGVRRRIPRWAWTGCAAGVCLVPLAAPWFGDRSQSPLGVALLAVAGGIVMIKAIGWLVRPRYADDLVRVALALSVWPALDVEDVGIRLPAFRERIKPVSRRLVAGLASVTCGLALAALGQLIDLRSRGLRYDSLLKSIEIVLLAGGLNHLQVALYGLAGYSLRDGFRYPVLAHSVLDFWSRYNVCIHRWLKDYIYQPIVKRWRAPATGVLAVFAFSGITHEYLFVPAAPDLLGWQLAFFMLHGAGAIAGARLGRAFKAIAGRRVPRPLAIAVTVTFVLATTPIFIHCVDRLFDLHRDLGGCVLRALGWARAGVTMSRS